MPNLSLKKPGNTQEPAPNTAAKPNTLASVDFAQLIESVKQHITNEVNAAVKTLEAAIKSKPAAAAATQPAAAAAGPTRKAAPQGNQPAAQQQAQPSGPAAKAATTTTSTASQPRASAPAASQSARGDLGSMSRRQLMELATSMGIQASGVSAEDLRKLITDADAQNPGAAAANGGNKTQEKTKLLMLAIDNNYDALKDVLELPYDPEAGHLGCGGDCANCPNPEGFATKDEQIAACFIAFHESLGIPVPAV